MSRCAEAEQIVPHVTVSSLSPEDWSLGESIQGFLHGYDNTNVLLWRLGPQDRRNATYIATTDAPLVNIIDPDTLAVTAEHAPAAADGVVLASSSHWRRELGTDNSLNFYFVYNTETRKPEFVLHRYGASMEDREEVGRFEADFMSYIHMISNTPHYAVIVMYPVTMNFMTMPGNTQTQPHSKLH